VSKIKIIKKILSGVVFIKENISHISSQSHHGGVAGGEDSGVRLLAPCPPGCRRSSIATGTGLVTGVPVCQLFFH